MKVNQIDRGEFVDLFYNGTAEFMERIAAPELFVVKGFYDRDVILSFRQRVFEAGLASEPSWHPLLDGCPDYHRLHNNYKKTHVKARMHTSYFHAWYEHNQPMFDQFREIFRAKSVLGGFCEDEFLRNIPSQGPIARVLVHHYPHGGGYQSEHVDPVAGWAKLQTLIQASQMGVDYQKGGLFARETEGGEKFYVDPLTEPGDLMLLSPDICHGVDPVDPDGEYNWRVNEGRWVVLPLIVPPDYPDPKRLRPKQV